MSGIPFPQPVRFGPRTTRWSLTEAEAYVAACAGRPTPPPRDPDRHIGVRDVARMLGVSVATVWRRAAESKEAAA